MPSVGEAIPPLLAQYGIDTAFGIPGTHAIPLYRGFAAGHQRHILPRHEQGAAFMADGYARVAGKPALCCVITGPGLTNASTGIAQAFSSSTPMLVITPVNERDSLGKGWGRLHEINDQSATIAPVTARSSTAMSASDVPALIADAFDVFRSRRPRPCHIEIPLDLMTEPAGSGWEMRDPSGPPLPTVELVSSAAQLLAGASKPVLIVGGGARHAADAIVNVAERLGVPVVSSFAGKGIISSQHPLSLGSTLSLPGTQALLRDADVVLAVGTEMSEIDAWDRWISIPGKIIRIDIDPHELVSDYPSHVAIEADANAAMTALGEALAGEATRPLPSERLNAAAASDLASIDPLQRRHLDVLDVLRSQLPEDAIVVTDMTQMAYTADRFLAFEQPGCYLGAHGYGTLGFALPAAIGAQLAAPERQVVAIAGDSGVLYTVQEMATAAELNLPITLVLWNNEALGQIRDDMVEAQFPPFAVTPKTPDFQALAQAFGWETHKTEGATGLRDALAAGSARVGPRLIEVCDPIA